ncbi:hypothetical protein COB72_09115 [bacterium]|nr:MAG: hypothetical protein COB72_09115 [bacterium]
MLRPLLQKRGDIYHFRWTVPLDLRPILKRRELTRSLKTSSKLAALSEAAELYSIVEKIGNIRRLYQVGKLSKESLDYQLQQIWNQVGHGRLDPPANKPLTQVQEDNDRLYRKLRALSVNPNASVENHQLMKLLGPEGAISVSYTEGAVKRRYKRVLAEALEGHGLEFDEEDLEVLVNQLIQAQAYYAQRMNDFLDVGKPIQSATFVTPIVVDESQVKFVKDATPIFSIFYERWLKRKVQKGLSDSLASEYERFYRDWVDRMEDRPLDRYRKGDIREFILDCSLAPKRNLKPYKGRPLSELLELEIPAEHRVAKKTADEVRKWLQGVFSLAVTEELIENF